MAALVDLPAKMEVRIFAMLGIPNISSHSISHCTGHSSSSIMSTVIEQLHISLPFVYPLILQIRNITFSYEHVHFIKFIVKY
jgi:hypothetical protein